MVPLVLHPHGIVTSFLKLDSWSWGRVYCYYMHQGNEIDKEMKIVRKKLSFMPTKRCNTFLKYGCDPVWVQFHVNPYFYHQMHLIHQLYIIFFLCEKKNIYLCKKKISFLQTAFIKKSMNFINIFQFIY